ncbi:MAG: protein-L-isoaspartate(D-aspartate) O-methyltransferase [Bacteroidales bacterium]|nr:protein-L-isoaspartate(D-aspartate) O-methyltransferase [Bacteroidales bacterium]
MDSFLLQGAKRNMIETLRNKGITDENVLSAMEKVDRHLFVESYLWSRAYNDTPLPIHCGQTISQPSTVAFQTQLLSVGKNDKILEIGTGSGYQAAVLGAMGAKVFSVERHVDLFVKTKEIISKIDPKIILRCGDGFAGLPAFAPFNRIIVTCGAPNVPPALLSQLAPDGIMVIPVGQGKQVMKRIIKDSNGEVTEESYGDFVFVPMLEHKSKRN